MREIKFRAWDKERNVMMDADYFGIDEYITPEGGVVEKETHSGIGFSDMYMVDISEKRILMQFTGLTDRNGVEIYEGDIVKTRNYNGYVNEVVKFEFGCFHAGFHTGSSTAKTPKLLNSKVEVLGNLYEHPHLLEGVK